MRKFLWILLFTALGYGAFWYLTLGRGPQYPDGTATRFARALAREDTATLDRVVAREAREDLARLTRELAGHPGGPVNSYSISGGGEGAPDGGETRSLHFYNAAGTPIMTVAAVLHKGDGGWKVDGLVLMSH